MSSKEPRPEDLAHPEYWDTRYASERQSNEAEAANGTLEPYDWFRKFEQIRPTLLKHLPIASDGIRILHCGCGNSTLTHDLYTLGYHNQINIDFSAVVIEAMKTKFAELGMQWLVMDVRKMQFPDNHFDIAIDKGTLDAMFHGSMWDPPEDVQENILKYTHEISRTLKPGGQWLYFTYRQPHFIRPLLDRSDLWKLEIEKLDTAPGEFEYFCYLMTSHSIEKLADARAGEDERA